MKQIFTLCLATAMLGTAINADAKMTLERAMQLKNEGKAVAATVPMRSRTSSSKAMKAVKTKPVSRFHKMLEQQNGKALMKKAPSKITPKGDNIYGFLGFSYDEEQQVGLYEFDETQATLKWADALYYEEEIQPRSFSLQDDKVMGYSLMTFWGYVLGSFYAEYDFATGELLDFKEDEDYQNNIGFFNDCVLNPEDNCFYGYGYCNGGQNFMKASKDDPFNYTPIKEMTEADAGCISICYNPIDFSLYGINTNYEFVRISESGDQEVLMTLDVPEGALYVTGLVYDSKSDLYYWNINTESDESYMATIDLNAQSLEIYDEFLNAEEYISLFTTDLYINPLQPKRPEAGKAEFIKDSLTGKITFTLPAELSDDKAIEGTVDYKVFVDGEIYSSGSGEPGQTVDVSFTVEQGMHTFGMKAIVGDIESAMATVRAYVGNDVPVAPANVMLKDNMVTWDAVTGGIHGGYVDTAAITYTVYINDKEAGKTAETSLEVNIPQDADLQSYAAKVTAECNGLESASSLSNTIVAGKALELPQNIEPTEEQFEICTIVDSNNDGATWTLRDNPEDESHPWYVYSNYSSDAMQQMDDWLFLPKMAFEDANKYYSFSFDVALFSSYYTDEYVEVLLCSEPSPESVVLPAIIDEFAPEDEIFESKQGLFKVPQPGAYYIAIHCTSAGDQYGIKACNFNVEDNNITLDSPIAVDDLNAEELAPGELIAKVSFTMPTLTLGGTELPADAELTAHISAAYDVTLTGKPGDVVSTTIETKQGDNIIKVYVSYGELNSPDASVSVFTGCDIPDEVTSLECSESPDMLSMTLTWDPVTTGYNGGYVNPETIEYDIYINSGYGYELWEGDIKETTYTYSVEPGSPQDLVSVGVLAHNEGGECESLSTTAGILGTPYELPFVEDFDDEMEISTNPWVIYGNSTQTRWALYYTNSISDNYADLTTLCMGAQGYAGAVSQLGIPRITTKGLEKATITLNVSGDFNLPKTSILATTYGEDIVEIGEITVDGTGFQKASVNLPEKFLDKDWVGLFIQTEFTEDDQLLIIEDISITSDKGSSVSTIAKANGKIVGGKNQIKVAGHAGKNVTISTLDGRIAAKNAKISNDAVFNVEKGIYIVKVGDTKAKVVVK